MSTNSVRGARVATIALLAGRFAEQGFTPGPSRAADPAALLVDLAMAAEYQCPTCFRAGLDTTVYHRGQTHRLLLACPNCGSADEF